jgi:hypothetical protein
MREKNKINKLQKITKEYQNLVVEYEQAQK